MMDDEIRRKTGPDMRRRWLVQIVMVINDEEELYLFRREDTQGSPILPYGHSHLCQQRLSEGREGKHQAHAEWHYIQHLSS